MIAKIKQLPPEYKHPQGFMCKTGFWAAEINGSLDFIDDKLPHLVEYLESAGIRWEFANEAF